MPGAAGLPVALALFAVACMSDVFDGMCWRDGWGQESPARGRARTPIADKLLMLCAGIGLMAVLVPEVRVGYRAHRAHARPRPARRRPARGSAGTQNWRLPVRGSGEIQDRGRSASPSPSRWQISASPSLGLATGPRHPWPAHWT